MSKSSPYKKRAPNGYWYIHWTEDRVGRRFSTNSKSEAEADFALAQWILTEGTAPDGYSNLQMTLGEVWGVYDQKHVQKKVAAPDGAMYAWRKLEPFFANEPAANLNQTMVDNYVKLRTKYVQPQTVTKELSYLLAAVKFCADDKRRLLDPACVRKLDLPDAGPPRDRWLREDEIDALLKAATRLRVGPALSRGERFMWIALETAARKQAVLDLTWLQVDFEIGVIDFNPPGRALTKKKKRAVVPISEALMPVLLQAYAERTNDLVMTNKGSVWASMQYAAMEAGLAPKQRVETAQKPKATGISPHVLRHTAATHMARRGVPVFKIAKVLGNTVAMVEKVYAKHLPADLRDAVDSISGARLIEAA